MVKVAIAGGTGQVAREIIDALLACNEHEITILSRSPSRPIGLDATIKYVAVDYSSKYGLVNALSGIHTVLSFIQLLSDPDQSSQKTLIEACIVAGVTRFAPSEYGSRGLSHMPWWTDKQVIRDYLADINREKQVLEYTLFTPGLFTNYLAYPHVTARYLQPLGTTFDFANRRAILVEDHDPVMCFTTVQDFARTVALMVKSTIPWPVWAGMYGSRIKFSEVVKLGEKMRGRMDVEYVKIEDLKQGRLETSWGLTAKHKAVSDEAGEDMMKQVAVGMLLSATEGAWDVGGECNELFGDIEFESAERFLIRAWEGRV